MKSLSDLDEGVLDLTPEDSIEAEIIHVDEVKEEIFAALSKLDNALTARPVLPVSSPNPRTVDSHAVDTPSDYSSTDPSPTDPSGA